MKPENLRHYAEANAKQLKIAVPDKGMVQLSADGSVAFVEAVIELPVHGSLCVEAGSYSEGWTLEQMRADRDWLQEQLDKAKATIEDLKMHLGHRHDSRTPKDREVGSE
jgi:hypothetical protein